MAVTAEQSNCFVIFKCVERV